MTKQCFKCKETLPLDSFYKHPQMSDGRVNKCKECNKKDVRKNREDKIDYYRNYDRERGSRQDKHYLKKYRVSNPIKNRCRQLVNYALRVGHLKRQPCESCGIDSRIHAHHDDYSKPLEVRWLCCICHNEWHKNNEPINGDQSCQAYTN